MARLERLYAYHWGDGPRSCRICVVKDIRPGVASADARGAPPHRGRVFRFPDPACGCDGSCANGMRDPYFFNKPPTC